MTKVFISQPMRGRSDKDILDERKRAKVLVEARLGVEVEILDSFFQGAPADAKPLWYLGQSLEVLSEADLAVFCPDYQKNRGCRIEFSAACQYDIPYIEL